MAITIEKGADTDIRVTFKEKASKRPIDFSSVTNASAFFPNEDGTRLMLTLAASGIEIPAGEEKTGVMIIHLGNEDSLGLLATEEGDMSIGWDEGLDVHGSPIRTVKQFPGALIIEETPYSS